MRGTRKKMTKTTALTMKSNRTAARSRRIRYVSTMWWPDAATSSSWLPAAASRLHLLSDGRVRTSGLVVRPCASRLGDTGRGVVVVRVAVVDEHVGDRVGAEEQRLRPDTRDDLGVLHDDLVDLAPDRLALRRVVLVEGLVDQLVHLGQLDAEVGV